MADYVAREWSGGDIVTAANLNHLEQGVETAQGGGVLIIEETVTKDSANTTYTLNKTWQEIHDAMIGGTICLVHQDITNSEVYLSVFGCTVKSGIYSILAYRCEYTSNNSTDCPFYTDSLGSDDVQ